MDTMEYFEKDIKVEDKNEVKYEIENANIEKKT